MLVHLIQVTVVKASKYGLIDPVKDIIYIALTRELKNKGKAVVDGVSNRLGKSCGNFVQQIIFISIGNLSYSISTLSIFVFIFSFFWIINSKNLNFKSETLISGENNE
jgi:ATP/ADP translocase